MNSYQTIQKLKMAKSTVLVVLMVLISVGWGSLWLVRLTKLWKREWNQVQNSFKETIFGYYGINFAVLTFPVILLSIIGLLYSSLQPSRPKRQARSLTTGSSSIITSRLVGVLSSIEILAVTLFVLFLILTFYTRISNDFKKMAPAKNLKLNPWQLRSLRVAIRLGLLAEPCLALLLLPILRGLSVFRLLGIQFEASVRYHVWLGTATILFSTLHGVGSLFVWGVSHYLKDQIWKWQKTGRIYLAGEIAVVAGLVMWITSLPQIRRRNFELFYYTHHLYVVFLVFVLFHVGDRRFYWVFSGIFLFGLDKFLRVIQSRPQTCVLAARVYPCKAVELILPMDPGLKYTPTSVIYVKIPSISKWQWHPLSIISSCNVDKQKMSVIIKRDGSWTTSLYDMIQAEIGSNADSMKSISIAVEGPYGPTSLDFLRYDSLLLVAGGIGITPFLSILQEITTAEGVIRNGFPRSIQLIYTVRSSQDLTLMTSISSLLQKHPSNEQGHVKLKLYVTQEKQPGVSVGDLLNDSSQVQTVHFDTQSSNYALHGLETFPWIAALVGISSLLFFICLLCFNHIFLKTENNNMKSKKDKQPTSIVDLIILLSFFIALTCTSLLAVLLRRKRLTEGITPVKQTPTEPMGPIEAEVSFGVRPNLEEIFSQFSEDINVGVLVCGPESMKECVASLCQKKSRCLKKNSPNYSFHALNFTL